MNLVPTDAQQEALAQMLRQACWSDAEIHTRLQQAVSPTYWAALNPQLAVNRDWAGASLECASLDDARRNELLNKLEGEGYFQLDSLFSPSAIARMREGVETLRRAGWPPVMAYVYDEFWLFTRGPAIGRLLSTVLGPGYKQNCNLFNYYLEPGTGVGEAPHRDYHGAPQRFSVWLALSDATLDNGCIYVIPRRQIPPDLAESFDQVETYSRRDLKTMLQNCRAVPVPAGTVLCWGSELIHWGTRSSRKAEPRITATHSFISARVSPTEFERPSLDAHRLPNLAERLRAISRAIQDHVESKPGLVKYLDFAQRLPDALADSAANGHDTESADESIVE